MFILTSKIQKDCNVEVLYLKENKILLWEHDLVIQSLHFDTRKIQKGEFFIALKGNRDGHSFVLDAYQKQAKGCIINIHKREMTIGSIQMINPGRSFYFICVPDTLQFLHQIAKVQRKNFQGKVYGVLGSNGKTTTKDFIYQMLRFFDSNVYATPGNWNNEIGLPITLLNMPENTKYIVLELGMNHPGEIKNLAKISQPDVSVITSIGREHMEFFSSIEDVAKAELEILSELKEKSLFFYPYRAPLNQYVEKFCKKNKISLFWFELFHNKNSNQKKISDSFYPVVRGYIRNQTIFWEQLQIRNPNLYHLGIWNNFFLAFISIYYSYRDWFKDNEKLQSFIKFCQNMNVIAKQRFELYFLENIVIIDDTYNANPDSFFMAIQSMRNLFPSQRLGCIAGHMAELGNFSKEGHRMVGEYLYKNHIDLLAICGNREVQYILQGYHNFSIPYFDNSEILANSIPDLNLPLQSYQAILIKGSRSAKMEVIVQRLINLIRKKHV